MQPSLHLFYHPPMLPMVKIVAVICNRYARTQAALANGFASTSVADPFDASVRMDNTIDKEMVAVAIGPPLRTAVVASPAYFGKHFVPKTSEQLMQHNCINQRMLTSSGLYVWDFERCGHQVYVRIDRLLIFNTTQPQLDAALAGLGIALLLEDELM